MNTLSKIKEVYGSIPIGSSIKIAGWVRSIRSMGKVCFLSLHDGSCFKAIQVVIYESCPNFDLITKISIGASIYVDGIIEKSVGKEQSIELIAKEIEISGLSPTDYPLQKKAHSMEFLREKAHLRGRTNTFTATFKVRSCISFAIHKFFNQEGFMCVNTPVITGSDCEGAGEMFKLANNDSNEESFFNRDAFLTVSGQLQAEALALSCGNIYSFGPTFRAEKSNTARHASEFWMVEPEMPFYDLDDTIRLAESMIKFIVNEVKENCYEELCFFQKFIDPMVLERINNVLTQSFKRISYTEAIDLLNNSNKKFDFPTKWGDDLKTEHERYICEEIFKCPVFVTDYPKEIKSFYMRLNDDQKTVAAVDLLVPSIGEIIGGSQREERLELLVEKMSELNMNLKSYWWYFDTRKYGSTKCSGFGLGFDRMIMYLTGMKNIRDVTHFPRVRGSLEF